MESNLKTRLFFVGALALVSMLPACMHQEEAQLVPSVTKNAAFLEAEGYLSSRIQNGRYMEQSCGAEIYDWPKYEGFPVRRCSYTSLGHRGIVYLLNPSAKQVATWIAKACQNSGTKQLRKCGKALVRNVWHGNNAQFPVAGIVIEGEDVLGGRKGVPVSFEFRHGVTVRTAEKLNGARRQLTDHEMEASTRSRVEKVFNWARPAHIHRNTAKSNGLSSTQTKGFAWAETSREDYLIALRTGRSKLFDALALALKQKNFN